MHTNFAGTDRQVQASTGKHWQREMPLLAEAAKSKPFEMLDQLLLAQSSFSHTLNLSVLACGKEQAAIAAKIHISDGYMSRFLSGIAQRWAKRLIAFMRETETLYPLQWMAEQVGCEVVHRDSRAAELAAAKARVAELERAA